MRIPSPSIAGELFLYAGGRAAFESSAANTLHSPNKVILLGGLSDGFMPTPYTASLTLAAAAACCVEQSQGWSVVQPVLSSSYTGFGHGSLERDSRELDELLQYLVEHRSCQNVCLVGHSTGCQQTVHYLQHGLATYREMVQVAVLQAPVSDREHDMTEPNYTKYVTLAQAMIAEGKGQEMMPRDAFWAPITAQRLLDLHLTGGSDDLFSSDFSDAELASRLAHVGVNCPSTLVVWSGSDEYVPKTVDGTTLMNRLVSAMNSALDGQASVSAAKGLYLANGNHNLSSGPGDAEVFAAQVCLLLSRVEKQPRLS
jgi:hypothetical protein